MKMSTRYCWKEQADHAPLPYESAKKEDDVPNARHAVKRKMLVVDPK